MSGVMSGVRAGLGWEQQHAWECASRAMALACCLRVLTGSKLYAGERKTTRGRLLRQRCVRCMAMDSSRSERGQLSLTENLPNCGPKTSKSEPKPTEAGPQVVNVSSKRVASQ